MKKNAAAAATKARARTTVWDVNGIAAGVSCWICTRERDKWVGDDKGDPKHAKRTMKRQVAQSFERCYDVKWYGNLHSRLQRPSAVVPLCVRAARCGCPAADVAITRGGAKRLQISFDPSRRRSAAACMSGTVTVWAEIKGAKPSYNELLFRHECSPKVSSLQYGGA